MSNICIEPELEGWKEFLDEKLTENILNTGYLCLEIPESFKLSKVTPENSSNYQYSVMYTPCDIRELALYCGEEQGEYISQLLKLVFERLLQLVGINDIFLHNNNTKIPFQSSRECKKPKLDEENCDQSKSDPLLKLELSSNHENKSKEETKWFLCRTVSVNSHSLPLSTPINWISCEDIEHILHTVKDAFHLHDMFYLCFPLRLKHSCTHEDKDRIGINVSAQKEMVILLTEKFSEFSNHVKKSIYFNSLVGEDLENGEINVETNPKVDQVKLIESKNWNRYYPMNSLRVGLFMTLKISTVNLFKMNPGLFQTPLFINPFYNSTSCPSCYFSWLRLINSKNGDDNNSSNSSTFDDIEKVLNDEEMLILALETKVRIFLNGSSPHEEYIKVRKVIQNSTETNGELAENIPNIYAGEAIWPGITSKGAFNPKVLIGLINANSMVLGAKLVNKIHENEHENEHEYEHEYEHENNNNEMNAESQINVEARTSIIEGADQWTQGGEIAFQSKYSDIELYEKNLEDFIFEKIHDEDPNCCGSKRKEEFPNDITIGGTRLVKVCSKYTMVPYFGSRSIVKINDSQVHGCSALGISRDKKNLSKNISVNLLSQICSYLPLKDFSNFRLVCRTHCCRTIFNSYVQNLTLFESDLYLPILGQLYPLLSKAKSISVIQTFDENFNQFEMFNSEFNGNVANLHSQYCRIPPIAIQCLAAYTPKVKKMIFTNHSNANLAKIISRASGRKPETIVVSQNFANNQSLGINFNADENQDNYGDEQISQEIIDSLENSGQTINFPDGLNGGDITGEIGDEINDGNSSGNANGGNLNGDIIRSNTNMINNGNNQDMNENTQFSNSNLSSNPGQNSQETELSNTDQSLLLNLQTFPESGTSISPSLIEIHIIGSIESSNSLPTSLFRIPITAPFRKLIRYFRDVAAIHEGIIDLYILRYGIKDRLIPDLSPIDYGILRGPTVLFAIGYKTLQYSQKIWISLFLVGSVHFPYLPKLRFNASMSTPFSRLAESYSRNVNISVTDVMFIYKDSEIDLNLSPYDYNVSENDTIEVILRTRINNDNVSNSIISDFNNGSNAL
ncbi:Ubiquitin-2 like Rad60 SUMO-like protein [Cryptosporidium hominis]|uniref:Ubiquitin-2 like Rad60 SUMO-like protein n=2 Tax=Cryptosporidium hominis TaxID=237895 RepID=A0ABX5BGB4_CRYHO|nr:Ubiquitin-2 like Rad60 SUMO-like protein [Cryptosporidium hominis]|eukprot:PPS96783.1 Ubiquitin-2 like Rad60 SUMO-like protein [Cryptosporidium hominis]